MEFEDHTEKVFNEEPLNNVDLPPIKTFKHFLDNEYEYDENTDLKKYNPSDLFNSYNNFVNDSDNFLILSKVQIPEKINKSDNEETINKKKIINEKFDKMREWKRKAKMYYFYNYIKHLNKDDLFYDKTTNQYCVRLHINGNNIISIIPYKNSVNNTPEYDINKNCDIQKEIFDLYHEPFSLKNKTNPEMIKQLIKVEFQHPEIETDFDLILTHKMLIPAINYYKRNLKYFEEIKNSNYLKWLENEIFLKAYHYTEYHKYLYIDLPRHQVLSHRLKTQEIIDFENEQIKKAELENKKWLPDPLPEYKILIDRNIKKFDNNYIKEKIENLKNKYNPETSDFKTNKIKKLKSIFNEETIKNQNLAFDVIYKYFEQERIIRNYEFDQYRNRAIKKGFLYNSKNEKSNTFDFSKINDSFNCFKNVELITISRLSFDEHFQYNHKKLLDDYLKNNINEIIPQKFNDKSFYIDCNLTQEIKNCIDNVLSNNIFNDIEKREKQIELKKIMTCLKIINNSYIEFRFS